MGVRCSTYTQEPKEVRMVKDSNCVKKEGGIQHKSQRKLGEKKDFKLCEERLDVFIFDKS